MPKTLLYRLFGVGRVPKQVLAGLDAEQILILEEGIGGSVTFHKYKAPGRRYGLRRVWFTGSLVATGTRVAAFAYGRNVFNVPFSHPRRANLDVQVETGNVLRIGLDAQDFHPEQSGRIEFRFRTERAREFADCFTRIA